MYQGAANVFSLFLAQLPTATQTVVSRTSDWHWLCRFWQRSLSPMPMQHISHDLLALEGDSLARVFQLLKLTQRCARLAEDTGGSHLQDALVQLEDAISDQIATLEGALDDDKAEAEESGAAERERREYYQRYRAA